MADCKLLSPARAMEWLYIDGLKEFGGLNGGSQEAAETPAAGEAAAAMATAPTEPTVPTARRVPTVPMAPTPCCETCAGGTAKFYSIPKPDDPAAECGECCLDPSRYWFWKLFEPKLLRGGCAAQGYTEYEGTETDGFGPLKVTNDRYVRKNASLPAAAAASAAVPKAVEAVEAVEAAEAVEVTEVAEAAEAACPDLPSLRSASVRGSFDAARLAGAWFENAFADPAQVGARCQRINNTAGAGGALTQRFATKYGPVPFAMTYTYEPVADVAGVFSKYADGAEALLKLPTVIVAVDVGSGGGVNGVGGGGGGGSGGTGAGAQYQTAVEFTCKSVVGAGVTELRLLSRGPTLDSAALEAMKVAVAGAGVPQAVVDKLTVEDYSRC